MTAYTRQELENALPDYLFGHAPAAVAKAIEELAATDNDFAGVLAAEQRIAAALDEPREFELDRVADHDFTRLKARIRSDSEPWGRAWLQSIMRPLPALAVALVIALGWFALPIEDDSFRTLSDSNDSTVGQIRVIFRDAPTTAVLERFERRYSLNQEAGPDMAGSYIFSVDDGRELPDVMRALQKDASLAFIGKPE